MMKKLSKIILIGILIAALIVFIIFAIFIENSPTAGVSGVIINEIMIKNTETCPDDNDEYYDWIELYNTNADEVDISGCGLSDDITGTVKYVFPRDTHIKANDFLIVYCAGNDTLGDFYTSFKLSSKDMVVLYDRGGNPTNEAFSLRTTGDGKSLSRISSDSSDFIEKMPSPGFPNTEKGIADYANFISNRVANSYSESGDIIINEVMAHNVTTLRASDGQFYDWIELYNRSQNDVNIKGYFLSDDIENTQKYQIAEDRIIPSGSYLIIFCSGNDISTSEEIHTPFRLSAYEESVVVSDENGRILDKIVYQRQTADHSLSRDAEGHFTETDKPTPGYPNTDEGYEQFQTTSVIPLSKLYISEFMGSNKTTGIISDDGTFIYPDYIELFNSSDEDIELSGYALSNTPTNPGKWLFPDITINSGQTLLILATSAKEDNSTAGGYYQTNFSISSDGDTVYLFSPNGEFLDKLHADKFYCDMSIGRSPNLETFIYSKPTPGKKNSKSGYKGYTSKPVFDVKPGVYDEDKISVTLSCGEGETIYYTTDCSMPTQKSAEYTGNPIEVEKNTVIRAKTFRKGYYSTYSCVSGTFLLKNDDVNHALPIVALVTTPSNLWDKDNGIYAYGRTVDFDDDTWPYWQSNANFWKDIEVPAYFEVFDDETYKEVFSQTVGINIAGAFGQGREQKGLAINARIEYGKDRLDYQFFETPDYEQYKSLVLRCGAQDQANGKIRDVLSAGLMRDTDVHFLYQEYKPYILYLNGKYWGVYFMREKRNRFFVAQHENLGLDNADKLTLIKSETRANYGNTDEWADLMNFVRTHDIKDDKNYEYLTSKLDIDSFTDYMICEIYVANSDYWNIQMYKTENGKWRFIFYDFCWAWSNVEHETLKARRNPAQPCSDLFNALLERDDYREKFIRRMGELMDTVFDENKVLSLIDELYSQVEPEIKRERSLFNTAGSPYFKRVDPANYSDYQTFIHNIDKMKNFAKGRRAEVIRQIKEAFADTNAATISEVFPNG